MIGKELQRTPTKPSPPVSVPSPAAAEAPAERKPTTKTPANFLARGSHLNKGEEELREISEKRRKQEEQRKLLAEQLALKQQLAQDQQQGNAGLNARRNKHLTVQAPGVQAEKDKSSKTPPASPPKKQDEKQTNTPPSRPKMQTAIASDVASRLLSAYSGTSPTSLIPNPAATNTTTPILPPATQKLLQQQPVEIQNLFQQLSRQQNTGQDVTQAAGLALLNNLIATLNNSTTIAAALCNSNVQLTSALQPNVQQQQQQKHQAFSIPPSNGGVSSNNNNNSNLSNSGNNFSKFGVPQHQPLNSTPSAFPPPHQGFGIGNNTNNPNSNSNLNSSYHNNPSPSPNVGHQKQPEINHTQPAAFFRDQNKEDEAAIKRRKQEELRRMLDEHRIAHEQQKKREKEEQKKQEEHLDRFIEKRTQQSQQDQQQQQQPEQQQQQRQNSGAAIGGVYRGKRDPNAPFASPREVGQPQQPSPPDNNVPSVTGTTSPTGRPPHKGLSPHAPTTTTAGRSSAERVKFSGEVPLHEDPPPTTEVVSNEDEHIAQLLARASKGLDPCPGAIAVDKLTQERTPVDLDPPAKPAGKKREGRADKQRRINEEREQREKLLQERENIEKAKQKALKEELRKKEQQRLEAIAKRKEEEALAKEQKRIKRAEQEQQRLERVKAPNTKPKKGLKAKPKPEPSEMRPNSSHAGGGSGSGNPKHPQQVDRKGRPFSSPGALEPLDNSMTPKLPGLRSTPPNGQRPVAPSPPLEASIGWQPLPPSSSAPQSQPTDEGAAMLVTTSVFIWPDDEDPTHIDDHTPATVAANVEPSMHFSNNNRNSVDGLTSSGRIAHDDIPAAVKSRTKEQSLALSPTANDERRPSMPHFPQQPQQQQQNPISPQPPSSVPNGRKHQYPQHPSPLQQEEEHAQDNASQQQHMAAGSDALGVTRGTTTSSKMDPLSNTQLTYASTIDDTPAVVKQPVNFDQVDDHEGDQLKLGTCNHCGRNFHVDRLPRHTANCAKQQAKPRKVFNASQKRMANLEKVHNQKLREPAGKKPAKRNWREEHEQFQQAMKLP